MKTVSLFKFLSLIVMISLVLSLLSACSGGSVPVNYSPPPDGEVIPLRPETVLYGIRSAMQSKPGSEIWRNGTKYVVMWCERYGGMFFFYDSATNKAGTALIDTIRKGGNLVNVRTYEDVKVALTDSGFSKISPTDAPVALSKAADNVKWLVVLYAAETALTTLPTFVFMFADYSVICNEADPTMLEVDFCADHRDNNKS